MRPVGINRGGRVRRAVTKSVMGFTVGILVVALALEVGIYRGATATAAVTSVTVTDVSPDLNGVRLDLAARFGPTDRHVQVVAIPVGEAVARTSIAVYNDSALPYAGSSPAIVDAVKSDIAGQVQVQAAYLQVNTLDLAGLVRTLRDKASAPTTVMLVLGGTLPAQAFSWTTNLVTPWVDAGGLLVWAGDAIGYYSVSPGDRLEQPNRKNPQVAGAKILLGAPLVSFPTIFDRAGTAASPIASALSVRYSETSSGLLTSFIDRNGAVDLGFRGDGVTSLLFWPHGQGGYLLFGGRVRSPGLLADDLTRILLSNVLASRPGLTTIRVDSAGSTPVTAVLHVDVPPTVKRIRLVATGSSTYPFFATITDLNLGRTG